MMEEAQFCPPVVGGQEAMPGLQERCCQCRFTESAPAPERYCIAVDDDGRRVQRFTYKGIGTVKKDQGVVWPTTGR